MRDTLNSLLHGAGFLLMFAGWYGLFISLIKDIFCGFYHFTIDKDQNDHHINHDTQHLWKKLWDLAARIPEAIGIPYKHAIKFWEIIVAIGAFLLTLLLRGASDHGGDLKCLFYLLVPIGLIHAKAVFGPERLWYWNPRLKNTDDMAHHRSDPWHHDSTVGWIAGGVAIIILVWVIVPVFFGGDVALLALKISKFKI